MNDSIGAVFYLKRVKLVSKKFGLKGNWPNRSNKLKVVQSLFLKHIHPKNLNFINICGIIMILLTRSLNSKNKIKMEKKGVVGQTNHVLFNQYYISSI